MMPDQHVERPDLRLDGRDVIGESSAGPERRTRPGISPERVIRADFGLSRFQIRREHADGHAKPSHRRCELIDGDLRAADLGKERVGDMQHAHKRGCL